MLISTMEQSVWTAPNSSIAAQHALVILQRGWLTQVWCCLIARGVSSYGGVCGTWLCAAVWWCGGGGNTEISTLQANSKGHS